MPHKTLTIYDHPLFDPFSLRLETPMVRDLEQTIKHWVWTGLPGGLVIGGSRMGKTTAAEIIANRIVDRRRNKLPATIISIPRRDRHTIKAVVNVLAQTLDPDIGLRLTTDVLVNTILYRLSDLACLTNSRVVLLFVDEIQRLHPTQLQVFADLYDVLKLSGIRLVVIFLANSDESSRLIEAMKLRENRHIYGRFFTKLHTFRGIYSKAVVNKVMSEFDNTYYPSEEDCSYTEYFCQSDFNNGFRFSHLSDLVWKTYKNLFKDRCLLDDWPAQYFFNSMCILLIDYLYKLPAKEISQDIIEACIEASNIIPDIVVSYEKN